MLVGPMLPTDREAVESIARLSAVELDVHAELERRWARIWVGRIEPRDPAAGFLLAWSVADELHVINVATHPELRRRGVANALMTMLIATAREERRRLVLLEVRRSNHAAIKLYRTHGFAAMGVRRAYYTDNSEDAVEMMLAIDPETGKVLPARDEIVLDRGA
jgi:ribosomal-protein-alanine N-acetyltransferase